MNCETLQNRLSAWHDEELPAAEREAVESHLAACPACRAAADDLIALDARLRRVFKPDRAAAQAVASSVLVKINTSVIRQLAHWRTGAVALTSAAAGFLLAWLLFAGPRAPAPPPIGGPEMVVDQTPQPTIRLTLATGAVEVEQGGQWKAMPTGGLVGCGQRVRTPAKSRCEFRTTDGSEVRLNHGTELVFESERKVRVDKGQVWSTVAPAKEKFQVLTPEYTVTALGTQFDVHLQKNLTWVSVLEGKTHVEGGGKSQEIPAGHQVRLEKEGDVKPYTCPGEQLVEATSWVHEILVLKGRDNPELVRRVNDLLAGIGDTKMQYLAEEEIRSLGDHCVVPLSKYLQSDRSKGKPAERQKAARFIAELAQTRSIGDMVDLLTDPDPMIRATIAGGLKRLTGKELGLSPQAWQSANHAACEAGRKTWQQWWNENRDRLTAAGQK